MPNVATVKGFTSAAVPTGGTLVVSYPTSTTRGDFVLGMRHRLSVIGKVFSCPELITVVLGALTATITYNGPTTIPAGMPFTVELDRNTSDNPIATGVSAVDTYMKPGLFASVYRLTACFISFGTPTAAAATSVCAAQAIAGAAAAVLNGTKLLGAVVPLGAPTGRALVAVSANAGDTTQVITITGTDIYNQVMRENLALNGTTIVAAKKAFNTVTGIAVSAVMAGTLTVGDGNILGIPIYLSNTAFVMKEIQDGAVAVAGTFVAGAGITVPSTATSVDVRGTYVPNAAPDGTKSYGLCVDLPEIAFFGQPQF